MAAPSGLIGHSALAGIARQPEQAGAIRRSDDFVAIEHNRGVGLDGDAPQSDFRGQ